MIATQLIQQAVINNDTDRIPEIERTMQDPDPALRETAVWAYAVMLGKEALPRLNELARDNNTNVSEMAADAVAWLVPPVQHFSTETA